MMMELEFLKFDNGTLWGFSLTGGAEYDVPLSVTKVDRNSIAESVGLQINDVIIKINNTPTKFLTHAEAHDLLIVAGNNLILTIERNENDASTAIYENEETINEDEMSHILLQNTSQQSENTNYQLNKNCLSTENEIVNRKHQIQKHQQKWSTFLQKPDNRIPLKKPNNDTFQGNNGYKVVIKKQKKKVKIPYILEEESVENLEQLDSLEVEIKSAPIENEKTESVKSEDFEETNTEIHEEEEEITKSVTEEQEEEEEEEEEHEEISISNKEEQVDETLLAEQLVDIQKKLQALSQLPSTFKETLNILTENLGTIIGTKQVEDEGQIENDDEEEEDINTDNEIINEQSITDEDDVISFMKDNAIEEIQVENCGNATDNEECSEKELENVDLSNEEKEDMEKERKWKEKEEKDDDDDDKKAEFIQRRLEQRPTLPLKPKSINRPIILPGGRRWLQPDDVCSSARGPKMTDEKIANTIETYTETIMGNIKGINFLKYEPPPKKLDYLQKSEVYKIIHDLEPPTRGIGTRASRILAEEDYYEQI